MTGRGTEGGWREGWVGGRDRLEEGGRVKNIPRGYDAKLYSHNKMSWQPPSNSVTQKLCFL